MTELRTSTHTSSREHDVKKSEAGGPTVGKAPASNLRVLQSDNPYAACGRTVAYLMRIPSFARLPFGQLSRLIVGQINRGHYFFVVDQRSVIAGYCGWVQTTHEAAENWFERNVDLGEKAGSTGPVCVINLWQASSSAANVAIISGLRDRLSMETELVLARRFYASGGIRSVRLPISPARLRNRGPQVPS